MVDDTYLPLTDPKEVGELAAELPIAVDPERFQQLVLGFPRSYLANTPRLEIVKHYLLMESLRDRNSISSLYQAENGLWKLVLVTRDREGLFSKISGTVSCFGMNIRAAQAFANRVSLALDTFLFEDPEKLFRQASQKEHFQAFLEGVLEGQNSFEELFSRQWQRSDTIPSPDLETATNNRIHPRATRLRFIGPDHFGLLFCLSRFLSDQKCSIEVASIQTTAGRVCDDFYISRKGAKLADAEAEALAVALEQQMRKLLTRQVGLERVFRAPLLAERS